MDEEAEVLNRESSMRDGKDCGRLMVVRCQWPDCKVRNPPAADPILFESTTDLLTNVPLPKLLEVLKTDRLGLQVGFCQQHWAQFDKLLGLKGAHASHRHETE